MNEFAFFKTVDIMEFEITNSTRMDFMGLIDMHAKIINGVDIDKVHNDLNNEFLEMLIAWHSSTGFLKKMEEIYMMQFISQEEKDTMKENLDNSFFFKLEDIERLLDMWKEVLIKNEVYDMIPSIEFGKKYLHYLQHEKINKEPVAQSKSWSADDFSIFEPLRRLCDGAKLEDFPSVLTVVEMDAKFRTGNPSIFRHNEIGHQIYPQMASKWYKKSSVNPKIMALPVMSLLSHNEILESHIFTLDDIDILMDVLQETMVDNEIFEVIPSIEKARNFLLELRVQREVAKADPAITSHNQARYMYNNNEELS